MCVCFLPLARGQACALASLPLAACLKAKDSSQRSVRNERSPRAVWRRDKATHTERRQTEIIVKQRQQQQRRATKCNCCSKQNRAIKTVWQRTQQQQQQIGWQQQKVMQKQMPLI